MKDYYKILGVKKNASEEEIREHWVELMQKLHPDQRMEGAVEEERVKEINEAYQVLKHSSTRVEYDLKRAYGQKKSRSYLGRLSIPIAIFAVLVVVGTIYLKKPQVTIQAVLAPTDKTDPINQTNQINQTNEINQIDSTTQRPKDAKTLKPNDPIDSKTQLTQRRYDPIPFTNQINQRNKINKINQIGATPQRLDVPIDVIYPMTQQSSVPIVSLNEKNQTNQIDQIDQINQIDQTNQTNQTNQKDQIDKIDKIDKKDERDQIGQIDAMTQLTPRRDDASTRLIATEEEVRQFFANYTERYTQKDLDGFLSLFSPSALQNRQDGLEGIRKIYANFFDQSQEIKYYMDDIRIEIYQNGVEVKARYELVQMLKKRGEKKIWKGDIRWTLVKEHEALKILSLDYQPQKSY